MNRRKFQQSTLGPAVLALLALLPVGCKAPEQAPVTSIVGAVLIDGTGGPPVSNSVITIEDGRIRAAGSRVNLLVPPEAEKIDGSGKFVVPMPINVLTAKGTPSSYVVVRPADPDSVIENARRGGTPVFADIATLQEARTMLDRGATGFLHMIRDTCAVDAAFVGRLRDLRITFVPLLAEERNPAAFALANCNSKHFADSGIALAAGAAGDIQDELEALQKAGIPPADVLVAATRNSAAALHQLDQRGTLERQSRRSPDAGWQSCRGYPQSAEDRP